MLVKAHFLVFDAENAALCGQKGGSCQFSGWEVSVESGTESGVSVEVVSLGVAAWGVFSFFLSGDST